MTNQTPPVSPDFAAMAREIADKLSMKLGGPWRERIEKQLLDALTLSHAAGRAEVEVETVKLRDMLRKHAVVDEYDYPGDQPVHVGKLCTLCGEIVTEEAVAGHKADCLLALASDPVSGECERCGVELPPAERAKSHLCPACHARVFRDDPAAGDQVAEDHVARKWETANEIAYLDVRPEVRAKAIFRALSSIPAPAPGLAAQEVERLRAIETAAREFGRHLTDTKSPMRYWPIWMDVGAALSAPRPAQAKEGPTE